LEAREVGAAGVRFSLKEFRDGSVAIKRKPGKRYGVSFERVTLKSVAKETRHMPNRFIHADGNQVTPAFIEYVKPLVGPLPQIGRLKDVPVKKVK